MKLKNKKGLSIIAVIATLSVALILALTASALISVRSEITTDDLSSKKALYIAEAGLAITKHTLLQDWANAQEPNNFPQRSLDGGNYVVSISLDPINPDRATVIVTGTYGNSTRVVNTLIARFDPITLDNAIHSNGTVDIGGNAAVLNGDIMYEDNFYQSGNSIIGGNVIQSNEQIPDIDLPAAIAAATANFKNGYPSGNYFQGDFSSGNPSSLNGVIFIDSFPNGTPADVHISGNFNTTNGNPAMLVILGDLKISGNIDFNGLIYTTGTADIDVELTGNLLITGSLVTSGNVIIRGNSKITYDPNLLSAFNISGLILDEERPTEQSWAESSPY